MNYIILGPTPGVWQGVFSIVWSSMLHVGEHRVSQGAQINMASSGTSHIIKWLGTLHPFFVQKRHPLFSVTCDESWKQNIYSDLEGMISDISKFEAERNDGQQVLKASNMTRKPIIW